MHADPRIIHADTAPGDACADIEADDPWWTSERAAEFAALLDAEPADVWASDVATLTPAGLAQVLDALQVERSRVAAREAEVLRALVGATRRVRDVTVHDDDGEARSFELIDADIELAATAMRQSPGTVRRRVTVARALASLPATGRALALGVVSPEHADVIARTAEGLPAHLVRGYESRVLRRARRTTPGQTASFARKVRAGLDAPGEEARRRDAVRNVDVRIWAEDDGLACLQARLPLADAIRLHAAIEARARRVPFDPSQSMGQRRVQAFVDAVCGEAPAAGASAGPPVSVQVTIDLATLLGLAADAGEAVVPGQGREPMTVGALRDLLADDATPAVLRRLVTDPLTGRVIDRGRTAYRITDALRAFVVARDPHCRFPMCSRSAADCDIDHVRPWSEGGATDADNLLPLCRRHHVLKTHADWSVVDRHPDGTVVWRAPDGREIVSHAWNPGDRAVPDPPPDRPPPLAADGFPF